MPASFDAKTKILPKAQQENLATSKSRSRIIIRVIRRNRGSARFILAIAFQWILIFSELSHSAKDIETRFTFLHNARTIQEDENTLVVSAPMKSGAVKVSFFGGLTIGRINEPLWTKDTTLLVASLEDLLATKLKTIIDRAEAKDYRDISVMLSPGVSLEKALGAFAKMYGKDPGLPLRAMGFFKDGDLPSLPETRPGYPATGKRSRIRNSRRRNNRWFARDCRTGFARELRSR